MSYVIVDRDGVINVNRSDYVKTADELVLIPESLDAIARLSAAGVKVIVVSNQAGVGRGLISPSDLDKINDKLMKAVSERGGRIAGLYYCPHRKDEGCECRKPRIGLFKQASADFGFDLHDAIFVGDSQTDIEAGCTAGCTTILVLTGISSVGDIDGWKCRPDRIEASLSSAVDWILQQ